MLRMLALARENNVTMVPVYMVSDDPAAIILDLSATIGIDMLDLPPHSVDIVNNTFFQQQFWLAFNTQQLSEPLVRAANNLKTTRLLVGQKLKIPSKAPAKAAAVAAQPAAAGGLGAN